MSKLESSIPTLGESVALRAAREVVDVMNGLGITASNRPDDEVSISTGGSAFTERWDTHNKILTEAVELEYPERITRIAASVEQNKVGNCEEQAMYAFNELAKRGVRPLALMGLAQLTGEEGAEPDHVFVVIGRTGGHIMKPGTWNSTTVICDPWARRAYSCSDFTAEMEKIKNVSRNWDATIEKFELTGSKWS